MCTPTGRSLPGSTGGMLHDSRDLAGHAGLLLADDNTR